MLFTQILLMQVHSASINADLIQICTNLIAILITQKQSVIMSPSPRVSVSKSRRQHGEQGSCQHLARNNLQRQVGSKADKVFSPAGQSLQWLMPGEISVAWSSTLVCRAQLSQQWPGACLSYTLKVIYSTLLGLLISILAPMIASGDFSPGAYL